MRGCCWQSLKLGANLNRTPRTQSSCSGLRLMMQGANLLLKTFVEDMYFAYAADNLRGKTVREYRSIGTRYSIADAVDSLRVTDFRTMHGRQILDAITAKHEVSTATLQHVKFFLSGVFVLAMNLGLSDRNPMTDVALPKARGSRETHAYSKDEVLAMLALPFDARTKAAIATAAFAGLREGEITGLWWSDYDGETITVRRSIDRADGEANETKTQSSAAPVPVIEQLKRLLDAYKATVPLMPNGQPIPDAAMFPGIRQTYADLDKMALRLIRRILQAAGLQWHGWHAFRRGVATLLNDLGVPLLTIQAILRHGDSRVTEKAYVKRLPKQSVEAMAKVAAALAGMISDDTRATADVHSAAIDMCADEFSESVAVTVR